MSQFDSFPTSNHGEPSSSTLDRPANSSSSGLTLILPALKGGKLLKGKKKKGKNASLDGEGYGTPAEGNKAPRPIKLKPLKEVLTKLIGQIKKKDDYAFFLSPVDASQVPGYTDAVKRPMDFGTMTIKVTKGKYRSLEEFASDFRLVISNAKLFNPPGSIYYIEAERIETWGLDHISKASATVIEYETDWNIEIEQDEYTNDHGTPLNVDEDDDNAPTPMDVDEGFTPARTTGRSPSVASTQPPTSTKRSTRGPYKKALANSSANSTHVLSESIDPEGRLPGSKDGIGAFPPGSDWARMMLALKLKGKRYRTKKERLRMEKGGPPFAADGSLDYAEMEDPFSVLSVLAPEPESRPQLEPLYSTDTLKHSLAPVNIVIPRPPLSLTLYPSLASDQKKQNPKVTSGKGRHWYITRTAPRSQKPRGKDAEKDEGQDGDSADASASGTREMHTVDLGVFASLRGHLAKEGQIESLPGTSSEEDALSNAIRASLRDSSAAPDTQTPAPAFLQNQSEHSQGTGSYNWFFTAGRASEAEKYIQDVVYGGVDGFAYTRSLAEFVGEPLADRSTEVKDEPVSLETKSELDVSPPGLGMSLAQWVESTVIDPLTEGRHALLRETARQLYKYPLIGNTPTSLSSPIITTTAAQLPVSLEKCPRAFYELTQLRQIAQHQIDMAALMKVPDELFRAEDEWAGKELSASMVDNGTTLSGGGENGEPTLGFDGSVLKGEGPELYQQVLKYAAEKIMELDKKRAVAAAAVQKIGQGGEGIAQKGYNSDTGEDSLLRNLRLNLLALAKRAPLDTIARLPADLVPEHIRHFVPTLG